MNLSLERKILIFNVLFLLSQNNQFKSYQDLCDKMGGALNISSEIYGKMLKTNQIFSANSKTSTSAFTSVSKTSKRSGVTIKKILPYLIHRKKDKVKEMETQFSDSQSPAPSPPRSRPFLNEQTLSISNNVNIL